MSDVIPLAAPLAPPQMMAVSAPVIAEPPLLVPQPISSQKPQSGTSTSGGRCAAWQAFALAHHMPLGLAAAVLLGTLWPWPGVAASTTPLATFSLVGIFFLAGVGLDTGAVASLRGLRARIALVLGLTSILLLSPAASIALSRLPTMPPEWALGLALFWAMPTTTSTGVLIVREAGGAEPLALALSVLSNVAAVFTAPLFVGAVFGGAAPALEPAALLIRLALSVLLPLALGVAARQWPPAAAAAKRWRLQTRLLSSAMLIAVPWMLTSTSALTLRALPAGELAALAGLCVAAHLVLLAVNAAATIALPAAAADERERTALVVMGAQKTINLAAAIVIALPAGGPVDAGLVVLPCILSHFAQTLIDATLGAWWGARVRARAAAVHSALAAAAAAPRPPPVPPHAPPFSPLRSQPLEAFPLAVSSGAVSSDGGDAKALMPSVE